MNNRFITVPKDQKALIALDFDQASDDQLIEVILDEDEFNMLWNSGFFKHLNRLANAYIDNGEDESITNIEILKNLLKSDLFEMDFQDAKLNQTLKDIKNLFNEAIKHETGVFFFF